MIKNDSNNALVVGKGEAKVNNIVKVLERYFANVIRTTELDGRFEIYSSNHFGLIVYTDTLNQEENKHFLVKVRSAFPHAKIIGLFDRIDRRFEICVRSTGLIFLGSFEHFNKHSGDILKSALK